MMHKHWESSMVRVYTRESVKSSGMGFVQCSGGVPKIVSRAGSLPQRFSVCPPLCQQN
ncbi:hypothetical protein EMIT0P291_80037 [Pseudomonas sp. IT-P291]